MTRQKKFKEVPVPKLRWRCNPKRLGIRSSQDVKPSKEIIGQERALRSLRLGLEVKHFGYNVFVTGFSGTGRTTTIKRLLQEFGDKPVNLQDYCYVFNFFNPDQPTLIVLDAGKGLRFRSGMSELLSDLQKNIPALFESRRYQEERKKTLDHFQERQRSVFREFEKKVKERGFEVVQVQVGPAIRPDIAPVINGQAVAFEQIDSLIQQGTITKEQIEVLMQDRTTLEGQLETVLKEMRNIERRAKGSADDLRQRVLLPIVKEQIDELREQFPTEKVQTFLKALQDDIMSNIDRFLPKETPPQLLNIGQPQPQEEDSFLQFQVNVLVDNSQTKGVPIVLETNPRFKNLFGTIDRQVDRNGMWSMDFTMIKPGALLQANGGFLVLNALDTLIETGVWHNLKRTLRNQLLEIQPLETGLFGATSALKPEAVPLDVKVVMIGDAYIYGMLYEQDDDFKKIFKVRADFDVEMPRENETIKKYINFIRMITSEENLRPFDSEGVAEVIEHGVRMAGRQNKLSTRFNVIADVLREANYWANKDGSAMITGAHVRTSIEERIERVRLVESKIQELILDGTFMIDSDGVVAGQVNGLSVYDMGEYSFGKPTRITAQTALGRAGIINIEREARLSGPTHDKGVLILSGYLRRMYAQNKPLVMSASIAFEQSYSGVDGDSASSTEIYALLSSLADVPLRQDIAVTGSVNQKGEIQPIGGVNQKIEGFFDVCKARGLTGDQGVLIPEQNVKDLMLRHDVVDAVAAGRFHIYPIRTVDEGIEILTGIPAGKRLKNQSFTHGSVHHLADSRLIEFASRWKELGDQNRL